MPFTPRYYTLTFILLFLQQIIQAQVNVSASVRDESGNGLPGAVVRVFRSDSSVAASAVTDAEGSFTITLQPQTRYLLDVRYPAYPGAGKTPLQTGTENMALKPIVLRELGRNLKQVDVTAVQQRGEQKGDTTSFNAAAFKTNPDATAEDLVKKMPGVTSDQNGVKVNGEAVQKVLVDGKPFFGDDPNASLKNLPADMIDRVEVFDKMSDQSAFTGFNDGDQQKTINLVTKKSKVVGQFGRLYAGAGGDENLEPRYNSGAVYNNFNGNRRVTLLLLSNNVNQQNFSISDLSGVMSGSQNQNRGGGGMGRMGGASGLMSSPQNGITTTQSAGLNYSDQWGKKITVSGSYFFNSSENLAKTEITRNYFTGNNLVYSESSNERVFNINHRANLRLEYSIDSANKIIYTPSISFQDNSNRKSISGSNSFSDLVLLSSTSTQSKVRNQAVDLSQNLLYQHKFVKPGRTISLNVTNSVNNRGNQGSYYSSNLYSDTSSTLLDQQYSTSSNTTRSSGNLSYTEPLNKKSQLQISYNPSFTNAYSFKQTYDYDLLQEEYADFNNRLSNKYLNTYITQKAGIGYRYNFAKLNFSAGSDLQQSTLQGSQAFPYAAKVNLSFRNILPNAMMNYKFSKNKNLRVYYRSSTNIPSISQLQNVLDISNPLQVKTGNDSLKQTFDQNLNIRFGGFDPETSKNIMFFINGSGTQNYLANATYILRRDTTILGTLVNAGSQLSKPVNLDGYYNARVFAVYGFPIKKFRSNLNINGGVNYGRTPSLINELLNHASSYAGSAGLQLSSNIRPELDFSIGMNGNYTIVKNDVRKSSDNNFYTQTASAKINWIFMKRFVLNTEASHTMYRGLSQSYNQQYLLWNAYLGYKFLKDKSLEAKLAVYDILNQNRSISRTVTGAYTEDNFTTVLRRYGMLTVTYTFRKFKSGAEPKPEQHPGMPARIKD